MRQDGPQWASVSEDQRGHIAFDDPLEGQQGPAGAMGEAFATWRRAHHWIGEEGLGAFYFVPGDTLPGTEILFAEIGQHQRGQTQIQRVDPGPRQVRGEYPLYARGQQFLFDGWPSLKTRFTHRKIRPAQRCAKVGSLRWAMSHQE